MKKQLIIALLLMVTIGSQAQPKPKATAAKPKATVNPLKNFKDSLSYAFGVSLGSYLSSQDIKSLNLPLLNKALEQRLAKQKTILDDAATNAVLSDLSQMKARKDLSIAKTAGKTFLDENKKRAGVKVTASGLQYEVITEGHGAVPVITDTVLTHYKGTFLNGQEFDNSYSRGQPIKFRVTGVIPGWTEALLMMPVGSKWKLYVPSDLGYGDEGYPPGIAGGVTLIFEMELLEILSKKPQ